MSNAGSENPRWKVLCFWCGLCELSVQGGGLIKEAKMLKGVATVIRLRSGEQSEIGFGFAFGRM